MENWDYHTVMEEKIKFYAKKYDPYNKLARIPERKKEILLPVEPEKSLVKRQGRLRKKILEAFDAAVAIFL